MIPEKIDSISITLIREKGLEFIFDWFEQHKHSFYILGWSYLKNQKEIEELFFQSIIKVHKELPRFKREETSFETWVTSIFIHACRELSNNRSLQASEESESRHDLLKALDQLKGYEKEAIALTYVKGISHEEAAQLLQVSVEKLKELLFSGIQSLRKEMGDGTLYNGCKEYHKNYIDYLERTLDRQQRIDLEIHIYHCQDCQEDLGTFQDTMFTMLNLTEKMEDFHVPSDFMENVKARMAEKEKNRQQKNKKRTKMGTVFASFFAILIAIEVFTGYFTKVYYTWTEENQELRTFLQQDLGERLSLEAESNGVKIKIKGAVADGVQTLVFYQIEDTAKDNQYVIEPQEGFSVENEHEIMNNETYPRFYPPDLKSDENNKEKNVYHGKIGLLPLKSDNGTIKLKIKKLQKLNRDSSDRNGLGTHMEYKTGEWNFEIPVTRRPSIEYALDQETEVEGIPVRFDKLIIAPTATILQYAINNEQPGKRIEVLNFDNLEVNNKKVKADMYGSSFMGSQQDMNWTTLQTNFDPFIGEKLKEMTVQFESVNLTFEDPKTIELDASKKYPQTFEYAGSTISIDKVEVGQPSIVVISNHEIQNRAYEALNFNISSEDENNLSSMEMNSEGVLVDKNGVEYDNDTPVPYDEIELPRQFLTVQSMLLQGNNTGEKVIPKRLEIYGYNTTKYLDDVVKISLE
ncbi:sigma-70 family RNA polymerase sigma factor [Paenibacillus sp. BSR1-1]|uniref:sigma-70 family RNA polymerase sigma factor n=1 Tax=Paenibacillus sp. BSR1-1 TaxID=3020845 RepID=UPI0025AFC353|nr:sigma-70 family RNA polymerase sigma factor [Paenibacillus sp. BSR1-1]MDN3017334.1 sigma-70 family RNA polymerase sigma factor [Paenibacillus sp. BSR1-1]